MENFSCHGECGHISSQGNADINASGDKTPEGAGTFKVTSGGVIE